jgi:hypothetical protein
MKNFPLFDYKREVYYKFVKGIRIIYLLNYLPFSKEEAIATLVDKIGWKVYGGKHHESKYTSFVQSYIQPVKFNIDYRRATLSTEICNGTKTRDQALFELKKEPYNLDKINTEKEYICKKLELTISEFNDIMSLPVKSFKDYPNDKNKLEFIYDMYRKYFKKPIV